MCRARPSPCRGGRSNRGRLQSPELPPGAGCRSPRRASRARQPDARARRASAAAEAARAARCACPLRSLCRSSSVRVQLVAYGSYRGLKLSDLVGSLLFLLLQRLCVRLLLNLELLPQSDDHRLELLGLRRGLSAFRLQAVVGLPLRELECAAHRDHRSLEIAGPGVAIVLPGRSPSAEADDTPPAYFERCGGSPRTRTDESRSEGAEDALYVRRGDRAFPSPRPTCSRSRAGWPSRGIRRAAGNALRDRAGWIQRL